MGTRTTTVGRRVVAAALAVMAFMFAVAPVVAVAAASYAATWAEYEKTLPEGTKATWNIVADAIDEALDAGKEAFAEGNMDEAYAAVNAGYYGYYETTGFERTVMGYISGSRVSEVELAFSAAKSIAKNGGSEADYDEAIDHLSSLLHEDANILDGTTGEDGEEGAGDGGAAGAWATFAAVFGLLLREGIEAILVIGAIIAYLVKTGNQGSLRSVYVGSLLGIACSFVAAWLLDLLKLSNAAPQEIIEGVTALIAVVVLYYVSNWMLSKSETEAWEGYIQNQVESSVARGSGFALAFTAWLAVFREGAEVILFIQPLLSGANMSFVWGGVVAGFVALAAIFVAIRFFSVRLPLKPFFRVTSILMFAMSISFLGGGIKELIEGDVLTMTPIPWIPSNEVLEVLGIYPCVETVVPQLVLLAVTVVLYVHQVRKAARIAAEPNAASGSAEANIDVVNNDDVTSANAAEPGTVAGHMAPSAGGGTDRNVDAASTGTTTE